MFFLTADPLSHGNRCSQRASRSSGVADIQTCRQTNPKRLAETSRSERCGQHKEGELRMVNLEADLQRQRHRDVRWTHNYPDSYVPRHIDGEL